MIREILEEAKEKIGFDSYVSTLIATQWKQRSTISIELLTAEIRARFNNDKMRELAGEMRPPVAPPSSGSPNKFVSYKTHDKLEGISREVVRAYYSLRNEPQPGLKVIRGRAAEIQILLGKAVRSIPLSKVSARGSGRT